MDIRKTSKKSCMVTVFAHTKSRQRDHESRRHRVQAVTTKQRKKRVGIGERKKARDHESEKIKQEVYDRAERREAYRHVKRRPA